MQGPYGRGTFRHLPPPDNWSWETGLLERGRVYRATRAFTDADGTDHPVGEAWQFLGEMFNKFEDELILCVKFPSGKEWKIPLIWSADRQAEIINRFSDHVAKQ